MMGIRLLEDKMLVQDKIYPMMYRINWGDGEVSDMVNKTRAKDAISKYQEGGRSRTSRMPGRSPEKPAGAFK